MTESRTTRREFLKKAGFMGAAVTLGGLAEPILSGPTKVFAATAEPTQEIINLALTAEQLATTFYYNGVMNAATLPVTNNQDNQPYLRAALDEENIHAQILSGAGAKSVAGDNPKFYFPKGTFTSDQTFAAVLEALETAFIEAYLAAIYQFASNGRNDLAQLAGQIMGVEAEHRVLGRVITNESVPNNISLEKAPPKGSTVADVAKALIPFLSKNDSNPDGPFWLPTQSQIQNVVSGVYNPN
ncbi:MULTISPECIES: ferritin-like domain-containing protein [Alicyclobacillus]|uniref:Tat (Twin-arginine translocation) pathway signal sequence n=2 Tax=Alicyclobacillus tolerans TaxID=90970 RepID=A0A1M6SBF2_9BACL|nr:MULTISPECIES: ferritin-like domain-containing protein [Alicyclobacillus]MDP9728678.1 hypothetical protein [Alicyclobacillus tengchongensis]SHK42051.1 Tat (twin-arginine translocation) pathway signal sequence [Alicyclobacillus montanus]